MHGVKRETQSSSADAKAARKAKEAAKLQAYLEVESGFFQLVSPILVLPQPGRKEANPIEQHYEESFGP